MADPILYVEIEEPYEIARPLIAAHHPHLEGFALRIVIRSKARPIGKGKNACKVVAGGTAEIISGRLAFFAMREEEVQLQQEHFEDPYRMFWMELSGEHWFDLTDKQKAALVDHELCHMGVEFEEEKDEPTLYLRRHDLEEFDEIVRRHGLWKSDIESFAAAALGMEGTTGE